jgi:hypothetical protein
MKPVKINLSTQPAELLATMQEELPVAWYHYRKQIGSTLQYQKHEDRLLDQALEEKRSLVSDVSEYISKVGNRWMTYVHTEYFPQAMHAMATHVSFVYYETYASCGAFFPLYAPPSVKNRGKQKKQVPTGIVIYTDHFFLQMSNRTGKKYRSKELIREFITTRDAHAMQADDDGGLVVRFVEGYGFGKWWEQDGIRVCQVRTYLNEKGGDSLNRRQQRLVEKLNAYAVLYEDGMYNPDVARDAIVSAAITRSPDVLANISEEIDPELLLQISSNPTTLADYQRGLEKRLKAIQTLGLDREMQFATALTMGYVGLMQKMLDMELNEPQVAIVASFVSMECGDMVEKYARRDMSQATDAEQQEFTDDFARMSARVARRIRLRSMTEERIRETVAALSQSEQKQN